MKCRDCENLERKTYGVWRCRVTGAHLSAEDLEADYPCPKDVGRQPERTRRPGILDDLTEYYEPAAPRMRALWEQGATAADIAETIGCGKRIAQYFIARFEREKARREEAEMEKAIEAPAAVTPASESNGEAKPLTKDELYARIAEMRRGGAGWLEIETALGVNPNVVHAALEKHGLLKKGIRRASPELKALPEQGEAETVNLAASFPATGGPPVVNMTYQPAPEAAQERPRPLIAGLAKTLAGGAAAQFLRGIGSSLELLPGRFRVSVRVEEVQDNVQG
ncbi:MAG: hypothetical protein ACM3ZU_08125 [Bacteroidota bacterium]